MKLSLREQRVQTVALLVLAAAVVFAALYVLRSLLIPFVLALFLQIGLAPVMDLLKRRLRLPGPLAAGGALVIALVILGIFGLLISLSIGELIDNKDRYVQATQRLLKDALDRVPWSALGIQRETVLEPLREDAIEPLKAALNWLVDAVLGMASQVTVVLIFLCFLLFGRSGPSKPGSFRGEVETRTRRYILAKVTLSAATGVGVGLVLGMLGVELALAFGLLAFLLNFVPSIGSIIATLLPLPVVLLSPEAGPAITVLAIALPAGIQFVIGNVVEPRIMGRSFDLHPVTVLMALIFWGVLWGIPGMILATPMTALLKVLLERHQLTRPVALVLAGRLDEVDPAVSPATTAPRETAAPVRQEVLAGTGSSSSDKPAGPRGRRRRR